MDINNIEKMTDDEKLDYFDKQEYAEEHKIIEVLAGSHAYGTNIATSDIDLRGVFVETQKNLILRPPFTQYMDMIKFLFEKNVQGQLVNTELDKTHFELTKYVTMLIDQNPNILEIIWADQNDIQYVTDEGQMLIDNRQKFLTKGVKDTYVGYAQEQLKRIKGHSKWINNPQPTEQPKLIDFSSVVWNATDKKEYNKTVPTVGYFAYNLGDSQFGLWANEKMSSVEKDYSWVDDRGVPRLYDSSKIKEIKDNKTPFDLIVKINKELYVKTHTNWKNYWSWKKNRNETRAQMENEFGFDVKHALHLVRLLKTGYEILDEGVVHVKRPDAQELLDIRYGKYTYQEILDYVEHLTQKIHDIEKKTQLPEKVDEKFASKIMLDIYDSMWEKKDHHPNISLKM
jgi:uncharacterized protein